MAAFFASFASMVTDSLGTPSAGSVRQGCEQPIRIGATHRRLPQRDTHNDVHRRQVGAQAEGLTDDPFRPIASHRASDHAFGNDDPDPSNALGVGPRHQTKGTPPQAHARVTEYAVEITLVSQSLPAAKVARSGGRRWGVHVACAGTDVLPGWRTRSTEAWSGPPETMACHLRKGALNGETLAAFGASSTQDLATVLRRHARSKTVPSLATDHAWLIGPFHVASLRSGCLLKAPQGAGL